MAQAFATSDPAYVYVTGAPALHTIGIPYSNGVFVEKVNFEALGPYFSFLPRVQYGSGNALSPTEVVALALIHAVVEEGSAEGYRRSSTRYTDADAFEDLLEPLLDADLLRKYVKLRYPQLGVNGVITIQKPGGGVTLMMETGTELEVLDQSSPRRCLSVIVEEDYTDVETDYEGDEEEEEEY